MAELSVLMFGVSVLFQWTTCLLWCPFHTVFITMALQLSSRPGTVVPPALFFLLRIILPFQDLLCLRKNFRIFFFNFCEECESIFIGIALNL